MIWLLVHPRVETRGGSRLLSFRNQRAPKASLPGSHPCPGSLPGPAPLWLQTHINMQRFLTAKKKFQNAPVWLADLRCWARFQTACRSVCLGGLAASHLHFRRMRSPSPTPVARTGPGRGPGARTPSVPGRTPSAGSPPRWPPGPAGRCSSGSRRPSANKRGRPAPRPRTPGARAPRRCGGARPGAPAPGPRTALPPGSRRGSAAGRRGTASSAARRTKGRFPRSPPARSSAAASGGARCGGGAAWTGRRGRGCGRYG